MAARGPGVGGGGHRFLHAGGGEQQRAALLRGGGRQGRAKQGEKGEGAQQQNHHDAYLSILPRQGKAQGALLSRPSMG